VSRIARAQQEFRRFWILATVCIAAMLIAGRPSAFAADRATREAVAKLDGTPLKLLVSEFNRKAAEDRIGHDEPKLTEDEVVGAIYAATLYGTAMPRDAAVIYREIAEKRQLPADAVLRFTTRWTMFDEAEFTVWWIDLEVDRGEGNVFVHRIRERILSGHLSQNTGIRLERNR
jgi:hypothetical protein